MVLSEAKKYRAYARECLKQAEKTESPEVRKRLIELSQTWTEAALVEERHHQLQQADDELLREKEPV